MTLSIQEAMARVPSWQGETGILCQKIDAGVTNRNYRVVVGEHEFALRLNAPNSEALGLDRNQEKETLRLLEESGIGPIIVHCSPEDGLLVTRWIEGVRWSRDDIGEPDNIRRLAGRLREVHALPPIPGRLDPGARARAYIRVIESTGMALPGPADAFIEEIESRWKPLADAQPCLCHNDVVHTNIIDNGSLRIVDWEYAAMGNPLFDLATITQNHGYSPEQTEALLEGYFGTVDDDRRDAMSAMQGIYDRLHVLWSLVRQA